MYEAPLPTNVAITANTQEIQKLIYKIALSIQNWSYRNPESDHHLDDDVSVIMLVHGCVNHWLQSNPTVVPQPGMVLDFEMYLGETFPTAMKMYNGDDLQDREALLQLSKWFTEVVVHLAKILAPSFHQVLVQGNEITRFQSVDIKPNQTQMFIITGDSCVPEAMVLHQGQYVPESDEYIRTYKWYERIDFVSIDAPHALQEWVGDLAQRIHLTPQPGTQLYGKYWIHPSNVDVIHDWLDRHNVRSDDEVSSSGTDYL
jgi:hypothetical protein